MNHLLLVGSLVALILFSLGVRMNKSPRDFNSFLAYRTPSSKRNEDTWYEANQYAGRCLMIKASILLLLLLVSEIFSLDRVILLKLGGAYLAVGVFLIIFSTERRLHKIFFRDGKRRPTIM